MKQVSIYVPVQITASDFRTFALFDTFQRKKLWRRPALFIAIMEVSAVLCYSRYPQEGSLLLGTILAVLGLALPLIWYLSYEHSLHTQAKKMGLLKGPRRAYTLVFQDSGIQVSSNQGKTYSPLSWSQVTQVYRRSSITYLYVGDHAYLLPHSQVQEGPLCGRPRLPPAPQPGTGRHRRPVVPAGPPPARRTAVFQTRSLTAHTRFPTGFFHAFLQTASGPASISVLARVRSWAGQAALHEQQHLFPTRRDSSQTKLTFHRLYAFRIPHLSAPCVYIPPRFVLCLGQKGGSPMDQIKIGRFVAETRRAKGLTQRQLADQLSISDKTISKWETGKGLPDVSLMLPLCQALDITVNDLLTGARVSASDYQQKAEENMMDLIKENQENKKRFALSMVCAAITVIAVVALVFLASYLDLPVPARIAVLALAVATAVAGIGAAAVLEAQAGYYECPACHELFVPTLGEYIRGYHTLTKRRLTCPHCGKTGMCRHRIVR